MSSPDTHTSACLYARVSTELQEEQQTIKSQVAELQRAILARGDSLLRQYLDDGYSGELLDRPALNKLRDDAKTGLWQRVYVLSPDRLARKQYLAGFIIEELRTAGIDVVFLNRPLGNTIEDDLLFNIQSMFAEYEKSKILDRQRRGKLFKARERKQIVGGKAPYGYTYVANPDTREGLYIINEPEAQTVRLIYDLYCTGGGRSFRSLVPELYNRGLMTRMNRRVWNHASLSHILSDETYTGTTHYNKSRRVPPKTPLKPGTKQKRMINTSRTYRPRSEWIPISVPAIISIEQFSRAQELKKQHARLSPRHTKTQYLLRNLLNCGHCDSPLYTSRSGHLLYYVCSQHSKTLPNPPDHRTYIPRDVADNAVWNTLSEVLTNPAVLVARVNEVVNLRTTVSSESIAEFERLEARAKDLDRQRDRLINAYATDAISHAELEKHTEELRLAKDRLVALTEECRATAASASRPITVAEAKQIIRDMVDSVRGADFDAKRRIVEALVRQVTIRDQRALVSVEIPRQPERSSLAPVALASLKRPERNPTLPLRLEIQLPYSPRTRRAARHVQRE